MKSRKVFFVLFFAAFINLSRGQVGIMTGWGMSICNTYSFNICPNQTITPFNYGSQGWACNNLAMQDISFNILGPAWRVAAHNYTFTSTTNGQITGIDPFGISQTLNFNATQSVTPLSYMTINSINSVVFAINGAPTTYTFNRNTFSISINPAVFGANNYTLCSNITPSISITPVVPSQGGPWTYKWMPGNLSGNPVTVSPSSSTIYTVTATAGGVCTNTVALAVTVSVCCTQPLTITPTPVGPLCSGQTATLTVSGAGNGATYTWNPGNLSGSSVTVTPASTSVYTVSATSSISCSGNNTVQVSVIPSPTPILNSNSPACQGQNLNLSGGGGISYQWSGPNFQSTNQNPIISQITPTNSGIYTLTVTDSNNCTGTLTQNIIVNASPSIGLSGATVCINQNMHLAASGGTSYTWTGPGNFFSLNQNPVISNVSLNNAGQYTVVVTDLNGCSNTAIADVVITPLPVPLAGNNSPVCLNNILLMNASGGVNYSWQGPNGFFSSVQNPSVNINSMAAGGNYTVTVTDLIGCSSQTVLPVIVKPLPNLAISSPANVGCAPFCQQFTCFSSASANNYILSLGNGQLVNNDTAYTCFTNSGTYTITASVIDTNQCSNTATYTVYIYPVPVADFNYAPIKPVINVDQEVVFTDASWGAPIISWNWYFMNTAQYTSVEQNPSFPYTEPGTYPVALVVKSDKGCTDTIIKSVTVSEDFGIYIPNAFTPNGDGLNDVFQPKGFGIVKYELMVFDRWGERLFTTRDFTEGWKGTNSAGKILKEDIYTWMITVTSVYSKREEYTGHVSLIR